MNKSAYITYRSEYKGKCKRTEHNHNEETRWNAERAGKLTSKRVKIGPETVVNIILDGQVIVKKHSRSSGTRGLYKQDTEEHRLEAQIAAPITGTVAPIAETAASVAISGDILPPVASVAPEEDITDFFEFLTNNPGYGYDPDAASNLSLSVNDLFGAHPLFQ